MAVELGVVLWERDPRALSEKAAHFESLGFAAVNVGDHLIPGVLAPLSACALIAGATERVRFGPLVLNNDFRNPTVLAWEAATLARASGGRFELGLGAGYARREYELARIPFDDLGTRAARLAESARTLRALLAEDAVPILLNILSRHRGDAKPRRRPTT